MTDNTLENSRSNAETAAKPLTLTDAAELLAQMTVGSVLVVSETRGNARFVLVRTEHHGRPRWWSAPLQTAPFVSDAMFDIADLLGHSAAHAVLVGTDPDRSFDLPDNALDGPYSYTARVPTWRGELLLDLGRTAPDGTVLTIYADAQPFAVVRPGRDSWSVASEGSTALLADEARQALVAHRCTLFRA
ncbi:hypothetical protein [Curtobacterium sp. VKM Ac-2884]|uniref:hypothetical protein n=1 Tax=Curtobacterium sp. VKM Ac-2884 TaxID=2783818 RepID=UPI00188CEF3A|nr:hypothetical protein [Curtobacterium sp. VKM Ac-2884]MBF4603992.1 hypothetical protein [Curtobacterium sp. VKM Ac-2884]